LREGEVEDRERLSEGKRLGLRERVRLSEGKRVRLSEGEEGEVGRQGGRSWCR